MTLDEYRVLARIAAIERDGGICRFCNQRPMAAVHHVYGRSRKIDWREHPTALVCVCNECHPQPLYAYWWGSDHPIVKMMRRINVEAGMMGPGWSVGLDGGILLGKELGESLGDIG